MALKVKKEMKDARGCVAKREINVNVIWAGEKETEEREDTLVITSYAHCRRNSDTGRELVWMNLFYRERHKLLCIH